MPRNKRKKKNEMEEAGEEDWAKGFETAEEALAKIERPKVDGSGRTAIVTGALVECPRHGRNEALELGRLAREGDGFARKESRLL